MRTIEWDGNVRRSASIWPGPLEGLLSLDVKTPDGEAVRILTVAPFSEAEISTASTYQAPETLPSYSSPAALLYTDLTIRVRMMADSTPAGTLYQMVVSPPAETTEDVIRRVLNEDEAAERLVTAVAVEKLTSVLMDALRKAGRA